MTLSKAPEDSADETIRPSRRALLQLAFGMVAGGAGLLPALAEAAVTAARLQSVSGRARLTLTLNADAAWRLTATTRPARLVLHLPGTVWRGGSRLGSAGLVRGATWNNGAKQLVLTLGGPASVVRAEAEGRQLVLEIGPGTQAGFARLASGTIAQGNVGGTTTAAASRDLPLVVLDPGHGGKDPGTIGVTGTYEKRITLAAATELKRQLEATGRCRVALTRGRDVFIPLDGRVEFARKRQATLFISLHADSAPGARGASVYTLSDRASDSLSAGLAQRENRADLRGGVNLPPVSPEVERILFSLVRQETRAGSDRIASTMVRSLGGEVPLLPNTHRQASFAVLKAPEIPSILVEMGFLSDRRDEAALKRPAHRAKVAKALAEGIHVWLARHQASVAGPG
jgi:N-acetylmuramoyl-L-alanine amidase